MSSLLLLELTLPIPVLATLIFASIFDLKNREVKEYLWIPAAVYSIAVNLLLGNYSDLLQLALASIPALLVFVLALLDMMGGADFLALLVVTLAHPTIFPKPITYLTLIYSLIVPVILILRNLIIGLTYFRYYKNLKCVKGHKIPLLLLGRPDMVYSFLDSKFKYLLTIPVEHQTNLFECRASFSMDEAQEEKIKNNVRELVEKGVLGPGDLVWVTPGLPQITFYLLGYVLALITPTSFLRLITP